MVDIEYRSWDVYEPPELMMGHNFIVKLGARVKLIELGEIRGSCPSWMEERDRRQGVWCLGIFRMVLHVRLAGTNSLHHEE